MSTAFVRIFTIISLRQHASRRQDEMVNCQDAADRDVESNALFFMRGSELGFLAFS